MTLRILTVTLGFAFFCFPIVLLAEADPMAAAGRIELVIENGETKTCSASLIEPDVVLTAAHCVAFSARNAGDGPVGWVFRPGDGVRGREYGVDAIAVHPLYELSGGFSNYRLRFDMAALKLKAPIPNDVAVPFSQGLGAELGERLFLASWRPDASFKPRQRICEVITGLRGLVTLGCPVRGGESGAPILRKLNDRVELVAVLSSRSRVRVQPVGQGANVELRLVPLLDQFK
ncbi:MAG: trypsin-like serine protease [Boseongicola sp.]|nr:MAG: trypsin-like serine protease [Boseongicola sp.]